MERQEMIDILKKYKRPGSPRYDKHFQKLPDELVQTGHVVELLQILRDESLPVKVRKNAAGALGEIGDPRAIDPLIDCLTNKSMSTCAAIALGRMRARDAADALKAQARKVKAARWAHGELGLTQTVQEAIEDLSNCQLREVPQKLTWYPEGLRKKVEQEIVKQFKKACKKQDEDLRWYVTAFTTFSHPDLPPLLADTIVHSWRAMGAEVGADQEQTCCGCVHSRTLRALKRNPTRDAVPHLLDVITSPYQRHAPAAINRLRELKGADLTDKQVADMLKRNAAIAEPIGQHALTQVIRFAGDYGGQKTRKQLEELTETYSAGKKAQEIAKAMRAIDDRL